MRSFLCFVGRSFVVLETDVLTSFLCVADSEVLPLVSLPYGRGRLSVRRAARLDVLGPCLRVGFPFSTYPSEMSFHLQNSARCGLRVSLVYCCSLLFLIPFARTPCLLYLSINLFWPINFSFKFHCTRGAPSFIFVPSFLELLFDRSPPNPATLHFVKESSAASFHIGFLFHPFFGASADRNRRTSA